MDKARKAHEANIDLIRASYSAAIELRDATGHVVIIDPKAATWSPRVADHAGKTGVLLSVDNQGQNGQVAFVELDEPDAIGRYLHVTAAGVRVIG